MNNQGGWVDLLESLVTRHWAEQIRGLVKILKTNLEVSFFVEIILGFDSGAYKFPQSVNKFEWSLLDLDSSDISARDGLGKVICSSLLLDFLSLLEVLVTESASDGLELVICSFVLL